MQSVGPVGGTNRALERLARWMALIGGIVVVILMVMITVDAIGRKLFVALPGALEFSEALMVGAVFLPLMYVQLHREHVFVSVATSRLPARIQFFLDGLAALVGLLIFALLTWLALGKAWDAWLLKEYRVALIPVPIWPFRWIIPLGTGLLCVQLLLTAIQELGEAIHPSGRRTPISEEAELEKAVEDAPALT